MSEMIYAVCIFIDIICKALPEFHFRNGLTGLLSMSGSY